MRLIDGVHSNHSCKNLKQTTNTFRISYSSISVIGIIGNIAVFIVVTKSPQMRTLTNKFIGNLAIADLFVNTLCVPFTLVSNLYPGK